MHKLLVALALCAPVYAQSVVEYPVAYPNVPSVETGACHAAPTGSTHEITFDAKGGNTLWITGQNYDQVVRVTESGAMTFYAMPTGSGPHGIEFDADRRLWVTLEFHGQIVRLDANGRIDKTYDVTLECPTCAKGARINTHPHGLWFGRDGKTIWYTGKGTGTVGRITPDGKHTTFPLTKTVGSVPIYVRAGNDGTMWITELVGNAIAKITEDGELTEFLIPTHNSRPIAIVPEPGNSRNMWFSEEAGNRVARITPEGKITEFPIPMTQPNVILAGLAFDDAGNLWVQQYVDQNNPTPANPSPAGSDHIIRIDKSILTATDLSQVPVTFYKVPTTQTVMHRIMQGPDGNIWFTELGSNKVGKVIVK
ncbi:MAG TPA: hypothetical protein VEK11_03730 [Thermoanaerobaculia bacterium]|jgi:virginiamycin B lyase|nr:hypothetical protein [Thermoanaerobaculia bacterium]